MLSVCWILISTLYGDGDDDDVGGEIVFSDRFLRHQIRPMMMMFHHLPLFDHPQQLMIPVGDAHDLHHCRSLDAIVEQVLKVHVEVKRRYFALRLVNEILIRMKRLIVHVTFLFPSAAIKRIPTETQSKL